MLDNGGYILYTDIMNMEAFILGCGGMMPLPYRHLTSVLLRREGELFLFDCGEGTQVSLKRLNLRWKKISAIFLSHMHADHVTGLPGLLMLSSQVERNEPLLIYGPAPVCEYIESNKKLLDMYINYPIEIHEVKTPGIVYDAGDFYVRCFSLDHTKKCFGYTLEELDRPGEFSVEAAKKFNVPMGPLWGKLQHGEDVKLDCGTIVKSSDVVGLPRPGRKFSFVTDTQYLPTISKEVKGSDIFICEGMFESALAIDARDKKHMTAAQAATIARDAAVDKMFMIHFSPRYTDRELEPLLLEAKAIFPNTFLSHDRLHIEIPYHV